MTGGGAGTVITGTLIMGALALKALDLVKYLWALIRLHSFDRGQKDRDTAVSEAWNGLLTLLLGCARPRRAFPTRPPLDQSLLVAPRPRWPSPSTG
jgi:hypothetical protein